MSFPEKSFSVCYILNLQKKSKKNGKNALCVIVL